ncbi:MAG: hypothetical protein ACQGVK_23345 [Myxococcota bacterium]
MRSLVLALCLVGFVPGQALATWWHHDPACDPDSVGSGAVEIVDDLTGAFWTFSVDFEVFSDDNCANPNPVAGSYTYVYTVTATDEGPVPVSLEEFRVLLDDVGFVSEAGVISGGPGVSPTSVDTVDGVEPQVAATFNTGDFTLGDTSLPIYIVSPYRPGDGIINLQVSLFAGSGPALVPAVLPEACPCSAFFWKLRALNWWWVKRYFPGSQFDDIKARAVELSGGVFADEGELVSALFQLGFFSAEKRAKRQLAALVLNLAAGELYPANTKCRIFPGTELDLDGDDVADSTVDEQLTAIIAGIDSGDSSQQNDAFKVALDINLGVTVIDAVSFH